MISLRFKKRKKSEQIRVPDYNLIKDDNDLKLAKMILLGFGILIAVTALLDNN